MATPGEKLVQVQYSQLQSAKGKALELRKHNEQLSKELAACKQQLLSTQRALQQAELAVQTHEAYSTKLEQQVEKSGKGAALLKAAQLQQELEAAQRQNTQLLGELQTKGRYTARPNTGEVTAEHLLELADLRAQVVALSAALSERDTALRQQRQATTDACQYSDVLRSSDRRVTELQAALQAAEADKATLLDYITEIQGRDTAPDQDVSHDKIAAYEARVSEVEALLREQQLLLRASQQRGDEMEVDLSACREQVTALKRQCAEAEAAHKAVCKQHDVMLLELQQLQLTLQDVLQPSDQAKTELHGRIAQLSHAVLTTMSPAARKAGMAAAAAGNNAQVVSQLAFVSHQVQQMVAQYSKLQQAQIQVEGQQVAHARTVEQLAEMQAQHARCSGHIAQLEQQLASSTTHWQTLHALVASAAAVDSASMSPAASAASPPLATRPAAFVPGREAEVVSALQRRLQASRQAGQQLAAVQQELAAARAALAQAQRERADATQDRDEVQARNLRLEQEMCDVRKECDHLRDQALAVQAQLNSSGSENTKLGCQSQALSQQCDQLRKQSEYWQQKCDQLQQQLAMKPQGHGTHVQKTACPEERDINRYKQPQSPPHRASTHTTSPRDALQYTPIPMGALPYVPLPNNLMPCSPVSRDAASLLYQAATLQAEMAAGQPYAAEVGPQHTSRSAQHSAGGFVHETTSMGGYQTMTARSQQTSSAGAAQNTTAQEAADPQVTQLTWQLQECEHAKAELSRQLQQLQQQVTEQQQALQGASMPMSKRVSSEQGDAAASGLLGDGVTLNHAPNSTMKSSIGSGFPHMPRHPGGSNGSQYQLPLPVLRPSTSMAGRSQLPTSVARNSSLARGGAGSMLARNASTARNPLPPDSSSGEEDEATPVRSKTPQQQMRRTVSVKEWVSKPPALPTVHSDDSDEGEEEQQSGGKHTHTAAAVWRMASQKHRRERHSSSSDEEHAPVDKRSPRAAFTPAGSVSRARTAVSFDLGRQPSLSPRGGSISPRGASATSPTGRSTPGLSRLASMSASKPAGGALARQASVAGGTRQGSIPSLSQPPSISNLGRQGSMAMLARQMSMASADRQGAANRQASIPSLDAPPSVRDLARQGSMATLNKQMSMVKQPTTSRQNVIPSLDQPPSFSTLTRQGTMAMLNKQMSMARQPSMATSNRQSTIPSLSEPPSIASLKRQGSLAHFNQQQQRPLSPGVQRQVSMATAASRAVAAVDGKSMRSPSAMTPARPVSAQGLNKLDSLAASYKQLRRSVA